ncbi:hypothetical protein MUK42_03868 [Musa troglodytarum]|uniref:Uncharacterized protein n=1 Tax=Musa troglodytarum TaxID=320322 RepID=A0A9E7GD29_9LILI|nr:hypothetical protein MUK42_03868 [Musa troglodytarum]
MYYSLPGITHGDTVSGRKTCCVGVGHKLSAHRRIQGLQHYVVDSNFRGIEAKEKTCHPEVCLRTADHKCKKITDIVANDGCLHFIKENEEKHLYHIFSATS